MGSDSQVVKHEHELLRETQGKSAAELRALLQESSRFHGNFTLTAFWQETDSFIDANCDPLEMDRHVGA